MTSIVVNVVAADAAVPAGVSPSNTVLVTVTDNSGAVLPVQRVDVSTGSGSASFTGTDGPSMAQAAIQALDTNGNVFGDVITVTQVVSGPTSFKAPTSASTITVS